MTKKIAESAVSGVQSMLVDGTTLLINTNDGNQLQMNFPQPANGKSAYEIARDNGFEGTEQEWIESLSGGNTTIVQPEGRFKFVEGVVHPKYNWSTTQLTLRATGNLYCCVEYELNGEKQIRFSGGTGGASDRVTWCFVDADNKVVSSAEFVKGEVFKNVILDVPSNAAKVYINGNTHQSPHLEVLIDDVLGDKTYLNQLLQRFGRKLQYNDKFAWKPMDKGYIAFTFDDSLTASISAVADLFIRKGVPCCFGAIPEYLLKTTDTGEETVLDAMKRVINTVGGEVLSHGSADEIVTIANIDDETHLFNKFFVNVQKFLDCGLDVRGVVRVGGTDEAGNPNLAGDPRTDEWVRLFYDYGDLYGIEEPYRHARFTASTYDEYKSAVDNALTNRTFCPLLFHASPEWLETLIDYIIEQGGVITTYAYVYDTFGSTVEKQSIENRLQALENNIAENGNEVKY